MLTELWNENVLCVVSFHVLAQLNKRSKFRVVLPFAISWNILVVRISATATHSLARAALSPPFRSKRTRSSTSSGPSVTAPTASQSSWETSFVSFAGCSRGGAFRSVCARHLSIPERPAHRHGLNQSFYRRSVVLENPFAIYLCLSDLTIPEESKLDSLLPEISEHRNTDLYLFDRHRRALVLLSAPSSTERHLLPNKCCRVLEIRVAPQEVLTYQ